MEAFDILVENSGRTVQYKLFAQSLRLFGLHSDVNDAHRAGANRLENKHIFDVRRNADQCEGHHHAMRTHSKR